MQSKLEQGYQAVKLHVQIQTLQKDEVVFYTFLATLSSSSTECGQLMSWNSQTNGSWATHVGHRTVNHEQKRDQIAKENETQHSEKLQCIMKARSE